MNGAFETGRVYRDAYVAGSAQFTWAPALANGAALLALAGIIGNVSTPDAAFDALTLPMAAFGAGLLAGVVGIHQKLATTAFVAMFSAEAEDISQRLNDIAARISAGEASQADLDHVAAAFAQVEQNKRPRPPIPPASKFSRQTNYWAYSSIASCAVGFVILIGGHATGHLRLEGHKAHAEALIATQPAPVAACREIHR
jgi:hypothetical protein